MQKIPLYKYIRADGGITVSPNKPNTEYTEMLRIVADDGKVLVKGDEVTTCKDVETAEGWEEIDDVEGEATEEDYLNALAELGVKEDEENNS